LKKDVDETAQNFSKIFNKFYDSIPSHLKRPPGEAQLRYVEDFYYEFSILLRERESPSLAEM